MKNIIKRLGTLLSVKSLVTLILTGVFAYLAITGQIGQDFMTIYAVIIAFYFGTQSQKLQDSIDGGEDTGAPAGAQRSGSGGERTSPGMSELSPSDGSEGYERGEDVE